MLCVSATAVLIEITSRENSDSSIPALPCVTPSHIAGTPPANCATPPRSRAAALMMSGKLLYGACADSISLYADTMPMFGSRIALIANLSWPSRPAKPCARFAHDSAPRAGKCPCAASMRAR